jgi:simple sugar transport system ATP-binding protein
MTAPQPPLLEARALVKSFGAVRALDGADFELRRGEIHALVGDNGAGKSTLIKVFSGVHLADGGTLLIDQAPVRFGSPHDAQAAGIETVYQDLALAGTLDAASNVFLGREILRGGVWGRLRFVDRGAMHASVEAELRRLGTTIPALKSPVGSLSGGQRQAVAVARAAIWGRRVLIMDEPAAALAPQQAANVLKLMDRVRRDSHLGVIFISHTLAHVFDVADRVTVMRRGRAVLTAPISDVDTDRLLRAMTGLDEYKEGSGRSLDGPEAGL